MSQHFSMTVTDADEGKHQPSYHEDEDDDQRINEDKKEEVKKKKKSSNLLASAGVGYEKRRRSSANVACQIQSEGDKFIMSTQDGGQTRVEVVHVSRKRGSFRKAVPCLPVALAIFLCILNFIPSGWGTLLGALCLLCCGHSQHDSTGLAVCIGIIAFIFQVILTPVLLIGYIWSIIYGIQMAKDALENEYKIRSSKAATSIP